MRKPDKWLPRDFVKNFESARERANMNSGFHGDLTHVGRIINNSANNISDELNAMPQEVGGEI